MARKAPKRRPGRRPSPEGRVSLNLTVRPGDPQWLRVIGNGNASAAVMKMLDEWKTSMRYEIHAVADENCDSIDAELLDAAETVAAAKQAAERHSVHEYGAAILDTKTGLVDYGFGFGKAVP